MDEQHPSQSGQAAPASRDGERALLEEVRRLAPQVLTALNHHGYPHVRLIEITTHNDFLTFSAKRQVAAWEITRYPSPRKEDATAETIVWLLPGAEFAVTTAGPVIERREAEDLPNLRAVLAGLHAIARGLTSPPLLCPAAAIADRDDRSRTPSHPCPRPTSNRAPLERETRCRPMTIAIETAGLTKANACQAQWMLSLVRPLLC